METTRKQVVSSNQ